jgi:hypothetical protein
MTRAIGWRFHVHPPSPTLLPSAHDPFFGLLQFSPIRVLLYLFSYRFLLQTFGQNEPEEEDPPSSNPASSFQQQCTAKHQKQSVANSKISRTSPLAAGSKSTYNRVLNLNPTVTINQQYVQQDVTSA